MGYIFSYVLLFMHAIHNTLTSIIKEFFIMQKINYIAELKKKKGHIEYVYLSEISVENEQVKKELPILLSSKLEKDIFMIKKEKRFK